VLGRDGVPCDANAIQHRGQFAERFVWPPMKPLEAFELMNGQTPDRGRGNLSKIRVGRA
jgi:hypothetical protein